jgi:uncharacterized alpha/beta hydrolase family protein
MAKKSTLKKIEKEIKKEVKKNWKKIIIISSISFLLVLVILFITGLRINFAIQDYLVIYIDPSDKSFTINNDEEQNITFHISTDNSMFCKAECSYILYDRSEENKLNQGSRILKKEDFFDISYILKPYISGSGQKIYNFEVECKNIQTFFCKTKDLTRRKTAFITLNYELTEEEKKIKEGLKENIIYNINLINDAGSNIQKADYLLNTTNFIRSDLLEVYNQTLKKFDEIVLFTEEILRLWSQENYIGLNSDHKEILSSRSQEIYEKSDLLMSQIMVDIDKQNKGINNYNKNIGLINLSDEKKLAVIYSDYNESAIHDFDEIINQLKNMIKKNYSFLSNFENDTNYLSYSIEEFNKNIEDIYDTVIKLGNNLSFFEYSKKCYLGFCENLSNSACGDLKDIIEEYEHQQYTVDNASLLTQDYYIIENNTVNILISDKTKEYYEKYCSDQNLSFFIYDVPKMNLLEENNITLINTTMTIKSKLTENLPRCCVFGKCSDCCTTEECKNNESLFPIIFIHGHSLLRGSSPEPAQDIFNKIQYQLQEDDYINAGNVRFDFDEDEFKENEWGLASFPITVKASYYYDYFYSLGNYIHITRSTDNIDTYAVRLNDIIKIVQKKTGKEKVNIVAHSMGGLVARRYVQIFEENSVDKLILIATPNKGIEGTTRSFCHIIGEKRECEDMYSDSILMKKLNDPNYNPKNVEFYTISGLGCKTEGQDGDGVVTINSSLIDYAESFVVEGECTDTFKRRLHTELLNIDVYPEVYEIVKEILK